MLPVLKYVRGDGFSTDHWVEMYRLLGMDRSTPFEQLTFKNFTDKSDAVCEEDSSDAL